MSNEELDENGEFKLDLGLSGDGPAISMKEVDEILEEENSIKYKTTNLSELELQLKNSNGYGYCLFRCFKFILLFEIHIIYFICLSMFAITQLIFLGDSQNPAQSIFVGFVGSIMTYSVLVVLYGLVYAYGYSTNGLTKKKHLQPGHPCRIIYFLLVSVLFYICVYVLVSIHSDCFDDENNYYREIIHDGNSTIIKYCNVEKLMLHKSGLN